MTASSKTVLYSFWRSSCAWRVRTALEWKGVSFEIQSVNLMQNGGGGEQFRDEFTKINPNQRVPTLVIDGHVLSQSSAILEYLEETRPEKPLLPKDSYQRALVRNVCGIIGADIQPIQGLSVMAKATETVTNEAERGPKKAEWAHYWIDRGFVALEQELKLTAGKYCVGDDVTLADVYLVPQVFNANLMNVDMSKFPTIARIVKELEQVAAFEKAHPSQQPDAPQ
ncbi:Maleylacetoacetate isomerase [Globisporangium polare]